MMLQQLSNIIYRFVLISILLLGLSACDSRPKGVINQRDMTSVLTDMHRLDGTLFEKGFQLSYNPEKVQYYNFVLKKYDLTPAEFDSSLVWYTKNPKKFEEIYDEVLVRLTDFENEVKSNKYHPIDSVELAKMKNNIWNKQAKYNFNKDSARTRLDFEIKNPDFMLGDVYVLKFLLRIAPVDSCKKQHVVLRINYANGKKDIAYAVSHNDSLLRKYSLRLPALRKLKIRSISGSLLGSKAYKGKFNCTLDSIVLLREYNTRFQDSLKNVVQLADTTDYKLPADSIAAALKKSKLLLKKSKNVKPQPRNIRFRI